MTSLLARSAAELLQQLETIDISVPPRGEGRTKEHTEQWSICRFLAAHAETPLIEYPLRLEKRERPDFLLQLPSRNIGIEVTEAVPPGWAWADARRERLNHDSVVFLHHFKPGEAQRSSEEIDAIVRGESWGAPWVGDAPERQWAEVMAHFASQKAAVLAKPGYERFSADWLLIYDNWPLPAVKEPKAAAHFAARLAAMERRPPFERIFVECNKAIWQFGPQCASRPIPALWSSPLPENLSLLS